MSLDAKPSIPSGATLPDVLQQDEDKSTPIVVNSVAEFIENIVKVNKADGTELSTEVMLIKIGCYFPPFLGRLTG
jgi:hypothetical protein